MAGSHRMLCSGSRRWGWIRTTVAACTLAALATACLDVEMDFVVRDDGSGSVTMTMRIDESVQELAALGEGGSAEEFCRMAAAEGGLDESLGFDITGVEQRSESAIEDGTCVVTTVVTWTADESDTVLAEMTGEGGDGLSRLDNGGWRFQLDMGEFAEDAGDEDLSQIAAFGLDAPTLTVSVTLPGDPVEHNAHSANRSKYTWEISFDALDELPPSLYVETAPGGGGLGPAAIGGIIAGIVLALAALVTLRKHQEAKAAAAGAPADGSAAADAEGADEGSGETAEPDDETGSA